VKRSRKYLRLLWIVLPAAIGIAAVVAAGTFWQLRVLLNPKNWFVDEHRYDAEISVAAKRHGLDPELVRALIYQESRFKANRRGSHGEIGLMQVLPGGAVADWARTKKRRRPFNWELCDVELNLEIGCWYLARAMKRWRSYRHGTELALAEYNAGASRAQEWSPKNKDGEVLPRVKIASTKKYIREIMERHRSYSSAVAGAKKRKSTGRKK